MESSQWGTSGGTPDSAASLRGELTEVRVIATGGMALIFKARQPALDRFIVVKKLKEELLSHPETLERFRREAKALASVLHQNVAHVYDFVENGKESYILMEYIDGIDVSKVIEKVGHLPPRVAASILLGVAKGVGYLHAHHLIHRDIKPSNIRLTTRGEVKLMDFGIVMNIENQGLTRPGMMVGSPSYLSPEQVLGDSISQKADLFLLGICFYEMLTGVRPFKDEGNQTVFQRIREAIYVPAQRMQSQVPKALDRIVNRCLKKDPKDRYESVKALIRDLETYLGHHQATHTEETLLKYLDEEALLVPAVDYDNSLPPKRRTDWFTLAILFLALLGAIVVGIASYWAGRQSVISAGFHSLEKAYPPPKSLKANP